MEKAQLKPKEERRLLRGHLWAYRNEFTHIPSLDDGALVDVVAAQGRFVGRGFYQEQGGIAVRILTAKEEAIDAAFLERRIRRSLRYRQTLYPQEAVYRMVYGESDGLPGLVIDRYGPFLSAQTSCAYYQQAADELAEVCLALEGVEGLRLKGKGRALDFGNVPAQIEVDMNGLRFALHIDAGQKTGMFLDQRENCRAMERLVQGTRVLDAHCYMGKWSCHAARAGAASVLGIDTSAKAIERAEANAELNGFHGRCAFECADVQDVLKRGDRYGVVILDPPALAKSRKQQKHALGLYQALNRDALKNVEAGGYLITSSCSHFVDMPAFLETLKRAAVSAQRKTWIVETRGQAPDHPVLSAMPETAYLKCVTLRVF